MVRLVIFPNFGGIYILKEAREYIESRKGINWRVSLAEYIDSLEDTHDAITQEVYDSFCKSSDIPYIKSKNQFFCKDLEDTCSPLVSSLVYRVKIVDVDNTRKWRIDEYDGAEGIEYFNEPVLVDKELNMYKW